jgi:hypothetical protein
MLNATAGAWNRNSIEEKGGGQISEDEYHTFVEPFEGISRLEAIHASLKPEDIVEPAKAPTSKIKNTDFPENLSFSEEEKTAFKAIHKFLTTLQRSSLGLRNTDTFAQDHKLENLRAHVLRFLWILANYGEFEEDKNAYLVVDARTYMDNRGSEKTLSMWSFIQDTVFKILAEFGVSCRRIVLKGVKEEDLAAGTGYLRSKGWVMKMPFDEEIGGKSALKALKTYIQKVDEKYGKKAFQYYQDVGMRINRNVIN